MKLTHCGSNTAVHTNVVPHHLCACARSGVSDREHGPPSRDRSTPGFRSQIKQLAHSARRLDAKADARVGGHAVGLVDHGEHLALHRVSRQQEPDLAEPGVADQPDRGGRRRDSDVLGGTWRGHVECQHLEHEPAGRGQRAGDKHGAVGLDRAASEAAQQPNSATAASHVGVTLVSSSERRAVPTAAPPQHGKAYATSLREHIAEARNWALSLPNDVAKGMAHTINEERSVAEIEDGYKNEAANDIFIAEGLPHDAKGVIDLFFEKARLGMKVGCKC